MTGVIKWPLKLHGRFLRFEVFSKSKKQDFLRFLSCRTRLPEHCGGSITCEEQ